MYLTNLDDETRLHMRIELERDIESGTLYLSPRLTERGRSIYADLLREAVDGGSPESLAAALRGHLVTQEPSRSKLGKVFYRSVPPSAHVTLAEDEFNRLYVRGLCARVVANGGSEVQVYRARAVMVPRARSRQLVEAVLDAQRVLDDLRTHVAIDPVLGVPGGPNSGLSVQLPVPGHPE